MRELSGPERVKRARRKRNLWFWVYDVVSRAVDAAMTAVMIIGAGCFAGIGFGAGLAIVFVLI